MILKLITNALAYGKNPLLTRELRHRTGLVYTVGAYLFQFQDVNLFYISTASSVPGEAVHGVRNVLRGFSSGLTSEQCSLWKDQYRSILVRTLSGPFAELNFLSELCRLYGRFFAPHDVLDELNTITVADMLRITETYLKDQNLLLTIFGPHPVSVDLST